jgi:hypothetical protein
MTATRITADDRLALSRIANATSSAERRQHVVPDHLVRHHLVDTDNHITAAGRLALLDRVPSDAKMAGGTVGGAAQALGDILNVEEFHAAVASLDTDDDWTQELRDAGMEFAVVLTDGAVIEWGLNGSVRFHGRITV